MKISKAQTLALFLGAASATTPIEVINGPSDASKIPEGQTAINASSGTTCNGNADCATDGESCGNFQSGDTPTNLCVQTRYCGSLGKIDGVPFNIQCWVDPAESETAVTPAAVDEAQLLADLGDLITKNDPWTDADNLFVSSRFNWQDGWWILDTAETVNVLNETSGLQEPVANPNLNKWVETDKPLDNRCFQDIQCPGKCCAYYPDTNNRRCMDKALHNTEITVGPVTFTPICKSLLPSEDEEVINAGDDIAAGALAEAAEALSTYWEGVKADALAALGEDATQEQKDAFEEEWEASENKRTEMETELKTAMGYDTDSCDDEGKERFQAELLKFYKARYTTCKNEEGGIACIEADKIYKTKIATQFGDADDAEKKNWFCEMDSEERAAFDEAWGDLEKKEESSLAAAWVKENQPEAGKAGSACEGGSSGDVASDLVGSLLGGGSGGKCTNEAHCCGVSSPKGNFVATDEEKLKNICVDKTTLAYTDGLGREFTHVCLAAKLMAAAAAACTMATSLM